MLIRYILRASYGNDSIALIQWAREEGLTDVAVVYSDTGWSRAWWAQRVEQMEDWVRSLGFVPARTESIGMEELLKSKKMWPQRLMQFCTKELKMVPTMAWLAKHDPERRAIILTGIRREESEDGSDGSTGACDPAPGWTSRFASPLPPASGALPRPGRDPWPRSSPMALRIRS